jgi:hypothetical protein
VRGCSEPSYFAQWDDEKLDDLDPERTGDAGKFQGLETLKQVRGWIVLG